ncbi:MAG: hypothetical protein PHH93_13810 [Prolixibacteraceae bacterium]|nr:hypothetical protein [Prolixibacteraceae bacterium]
MPQGLIYDTLGVSGHCSVKDVRKHYVIENKTAMICNSDVHYLEQIGEICSVFHLEEINFSEIRMALNKKNNRYVEGQ